MKYITQKIFCFFILFYSLLQNSDAQTFLNGSFEINTAGTDQINLANPTFNGFMSNTIAFGTTGNMDIISSPTYCGLAENGSWYTSLTGSGTDAITMQLSAPLVAGTTYTISFWDRGCWGTYSASAPPVQLGVSTVSGAVGTNFFTAGAPANGTWVNRTTTFVAPISGAFISVQLASGSTGDWTQIDDFTFVTSSLTPTANFTTPTTTFCAGTCIPFTDLSTNSPTTWSWTFTGGTPSTSTLQNPTNICYNTPGTYPVSLTVTNGAGSNTDTQAGYITVNPIDNAAFNYSSGTYCQSAPNPTPTITGTPGGTFTSTPGLSINPATGAINLLASTLGTYTVTYTTSGACPATSTATVTIVSSATAAFSYAGPYCQNGINPSPTMAAGATMGTFSSTAGLSITPSTGVVNLAASTAGTYTVTNTVAAGGGCPAVTATATITINPVQSAAFNYSAASYCQSAANPTPTITGVAGGIFTVAPAGLTFVSAATGQINLAGSTPNTYTITYTTPGPCVGTSTATVTITAPSVAAFTYAGPYCQNAANPSPTFTGGGVAGTFTSTAGLSITPSTGVVNLAGSTAGTYTVTNTIAASGPCPAITATASITINPVQSAAFNYSAAAYCQSSPNPTPTITGVAGGTFTSVPAGLAFVSAATGQINLAGSTPNTYTITYTTPGPCPGTSTATVTINAGSIPTFNYAGPYCQNAPNPSPTFTGGGVAGTFTSTAGLSITAGTGVVNLAASTPGTYTVTNTIAATGSCPAVTATATITINPVPVAVITGPTSVCEGGSITLTGSGGTTYGWSTGAGTAAITLNPTITATYILTATSAGCSDTAHHTVTVTPAPINDVNAQMCVGQTYTLPSGTIVSAAGVYNDTITTAGGCDSVNIITLTVNTATANAGTDTTIAYGTTVALGATGGVSYTWTPSYGLSCTTCANPVASPLQTTAYIVTATNANGCRATDTIIVFVEPLPCQGSAIDMKTLIPNAFSPNGDNLNDVLCIPENPCISAISLIIYDRWGEQVYESHSISQCWDGFYRGKELNAGVYAYYLTVTFTTGEVSKGKGNITLIK